MSQHPGLSEFSPPDPADLQRLLPAYAFDSLIAKGGMGAVYKARQISLDRDVAVKILPRELGADSQFRQGFETEARAMARLNHANLIGVYDSGDLQGMPFIVMEYIPGKSLYHSAYGKQVHPDEVVRLALGILAGLGHAHEHGIIHRDIKPANILLTAKAEPKIGDFGLAVPMDAEGPGLVMGTPGYTAPEVIKNPHAADRRSDIFAVGVIFYELLTGERPAEGAPPPSALCQCPPALDAIYQRATHPNPAFRYPDCAAMAAALEAAVRPAPAARPMVRTATPAAPLVLQKAAPRPPAPPAPAPAEPSAAPAAAEPPAAPAAPPAAAQPPPEIQIGSNWGLVRNLLIIAGLIVGIAFAWKLYQQRRGRVDAENRRRQAEAVQRQAEEEVRQLDARKAAAERRAAELAEAARRKNEPPSPPEPPPETPFQALQRLRTSLAAGSREEMPPGTARRGHSDFFLVAEPMGWHQAALFAEQHGGHLAVAATDEDLTWFAERLNEGSAWIGAGRDEANNWVGIDGSPWQLGVKPAGRGSFAALSDLGLVRGTPPPTELPFFIQWHRDGSNPATLDAMLQRLRETLADPDPLFPPGTVRQQARNFLLVLRPATWRDAHTTAERAGGHLMVASDLTEAVWLERFITEQQAPEGVWLGGSLANDAWSWTTGEPWSVDRWADGQPATTTGAAAVMTDAKGAWITAKPDQVAAGFLIEWSADHQTSVADATRINPATTGIAELKNKARQLVTDALGERDKALAANARTFLWDLDVWLRGLSQAEQAVWGAHVQKLKQKVANNRVPGQVTAADAIQLSPRMGDIATYAAKKQQEIDAALADKLTRIRDAYLGRLTSQLADAERAGHLSLAREIKQAYEQARVDADDLPDVFGINQ